MPLWPKIALSLVAVAVCFGGVVAYRHYAEESAEAARLAQVEKETKEWYFLSDEEKWEAYYTQPRTRAIPWGAEPPEGPDRRALTDDERACFDALAMPLFGPNPYAYNNFNQCKAEGAANRAAAATALLIEQQEAWQQQQLAAAEAAELAEAAAAAEAVQQQIAAIEAARAAEQAEFTASDRALRGGDPDALTAFPLPDGWTNGMEICNHSGSRIKIGMAWQNTIGNGLRAILGGILASAEFAAAGFSPIASGDCEEIGFGFGNGPVSGYLSIFRETSVGWVADEYTPMGDASADTTAYGLSKTMCWPESYASDIDPDYDCPGDARSVRFNLWFKRIAATTQLRITVRPSTYLVETGVLR